MEAVTGIDVSWMTHCSPKDKLSRGRTSVQPACRDLAPPPHGANGGAGPTPNGSGAVEHGEKDALPLSNATPSSTAAPSSSSPAAPPAPPAPPASSPKSSGLSRPPIGPRTSSNDKTSSGAPLTRRNSWFANISSKFTSSSSAPPPSPPPAPAPGTSPPSANVTTPSGAETTASDTSTNNKSQEGGSTNPPVPRPVPPKNAVLPHAVRHDGDAPYTPAPPRTSSQGVSFLQVIRRLSASAGGSLAAAGTGSGPGGLRNNHGLVDRVVLNVDRHRERCPIAELTDSKLRRVAFCVDVEIAPMPKYGVGNGSGKGGAGASGKAQKRKSGEKGEGAALKSAKVLEEGSEMEVEKKAKEIDDAVTKEAGMFESEKAKEDGKDVAAPVDKGKDQVSKKKEKKKKSEEERKARKEKKRKLAEANGSIPMEIYIEQSDSSGGSSPTQAETPRTYASATTNPVRIYRRCCQLRETPIFKKLTEQLQDPDNVNSETGVVEKLDLTGYWMQLADLVTLGDYLAIVPIKEVILESCGLTDEGLRVVLCGLLACKKSDGVRRKTQGVADGLVKQGGVCERLVLKGNKIGIEGWKYICLFIFMCRSLKVLDLSDIPFPRPVDHPRTPVSAAAQGGAKQQPPVDLAFLLSKAIGERLAGNSLDLLNLGGSDMNADQLGVVMNGVIECGVRRLGLAHVPHLDDEGIQYVARYIRSKKCEGLDLTGNDLRDRLDAIANALTDDHPLWALSLADCNLTTKHLCRLLSKLSKLQNFRFIDLSHNQELFGSEHSALSLLRRYIPKMRSLKRIHLADVSMSPEDAIAIAEVIPESVGLAHINILENPRIAALANAMTEESQEEACALYASLLAAARLSKTIVCIDVDVPTEESGEIVRALAKQVVAYCLRNLERVDVEKADGDDPAYPDVLVHLVGHDVTAPDKPGEDDVSGPDEDYVIGGTGVVKALTCCLNNSGGESRRQSGEFIRDAEDGVPPSSDRPKIPPGKAKDLSKHLLLSARKIRVRLQPALAKAKAASHDDRANYYKLMFLDQTLDGIIKRFEDEFPETRVAADSGQPEAAAAVTPPTVEFTEEAPLTTQSSRETDERDDKEDALLFSDVDDYVDVHRPPHSNLSRTNSLSRMLTEQEGKTLRHGYNFRSRYLSREHVDVIRGLKEVGDDPKLNQVMHEILDELGDEDLKKEASEKGIVRTYQENRELIVRKFREKDPDNWDRFIESQELAQANMDANKDKAPVTAASEVAVTD